MLSVKEKAYAKINLFLDVVGLREDGFHNIRTVMHSLSLCDELTVSLTGARGEIRLIIDGAPYLPTDKRNLVYKATEAFLTRGAISSGVTLRLKKNIPVSAGLAGGSSDAAATLRALNRVFGKPFSDRTLLSIAESLGSDVPYCLVGGTAMCSGRGEVIERLPDSLNLFALVAIADEKVSTPEAYASLDRLYSNFDGSVKTSGNKHEASLLDFIYRKTEKMPDLYNIFEDAILPVRPKARCLKSRMLDLGAYASMMSGSGPGVFGLFDSEDKVIQAQEILEKEGYSAFFARTV